MRSLNLFTLIFIVLFCSLNLLAQSNDIYVPGFTRSDGTYVPGYYKTRSDGDCSNNYSSKGNYNPHTGKVGTILCEGETPKAIVSAPGTGEFFLVPAIVRSDPQGTAIRFNTCGTALIALADKGTIYTLTDKGTQTFTPEIVLSVAENRFRIASDFDPRNYLYHLNLGAVLYRQKRFDEALASIRRAIELNPNDETAKDYEALILRESVTIKILDEPKDK